MEYILMALFGGGILDWKHIGETEYEWEDIFEEIKFNYRDLSNIDMRTLYCTILDFGIRDLKEKIVDKLNELDLEQEEKEKIVKITDNLYDYFEEYINYIDTHLTCIDAEVGEILRKYFKEEIEEVEENIGFLSIEWVE